MKTDIPSIVLASSSKYRAILLSKILNHFDQYSPDIDESKLNFETGEQLCLRLAKEKALKVSEYHPNSLIIASDQVALLNTEILGKPGNHQHACEQLRRCSGQRVEFLTSLCLYNAKTKILTTEIDRVIVWFRVLTEEEIDAYLHRETPYDCAGSFKCEGLGIALFDHLEMSDPNSLIGLPLIKLTGLLRAEGINPLLTQLS